VNERGGKGLTYRDAGVDIDRGDQFVDRIKGLAERTRRPGLLEGIGGFASLFSLKDFMAVAGPMEDPVLVSGTDGVGTKLKLAFRTGIHETIGHDLVAMCINDVLTTGATPLFFLDYFGTGRLELEVGTQVVAGIALACELAECALVGGETAELPGLYQPGEYDLAGFAVGVVDRAKIIDGRRAAPGDVLIGVQSRGLHSNGYSLAQKVFFEHAALADDVMLPGLPLPLAKELLRPTAIYTKTVKALLAAADVRALAHITGGGVSGNLPRVLPSGTVARLDPRRWVRPPIFEHLQRLGNIAEEELERTFNCGLGLIAVVPPSDAEPAIAAIARAGEVGVRIGELELGPAGEPSVVYEARS
jgi:phosphoribosylformylglycinamidine cyclo-ligase